MDCRLIKQLITAFLLANSAAIAEAQRFAIVTGTVFCDQCKDGLISLLDYPLYGAKVSLSCAKSNGEIAMHGEDTTNRFGKFAIRLDGTHNLNSCHAKVLANNTSQEANNCLVVAGQAQGLKLIFKNASMEMYTVEYSLLSQPSRAMSICRGAHALATLQPAENLISFFEPSACPYWYWTMPENHCHWRLLGPDMKVAVVFGVLAVGSYGPDMTLRIALQGKADPYRVLIREATTALLNSFNTISFPYHPLGVIAEFNLALLGSTRFILNTALGFKRANNGYGQIGCKLSTCPRTESMVP